MLRDNGPQRPQHRVSVAQRCMGVSPSPQTWHKSPHRADTGLLVFRLCLMRSSTAIGRENSAGNLSIAFHFFETFRNLFSLVRDHLFDYSGVDFSFATPQNLNLSGVFLFS